jgi:hypothetical protein
MDYHFEGRLTARDCKRSIAHHFAVPAGSGQMKLHLSFAPSHAQGTGNMLTLALFDPKGFRGAGHRGGHSHRVRISAAEATPGYIAGPLTAGEWTAEVDTHMVMPGAAVQYTLDITIAKGAGATTEMRPTAVRRAPRIPQRGAGWYRGDLHSHTDHSDADGCSVAELVGAARKQGLDFLFLTDHNTTSGLAELEALGDEELLTAGGIELTTYWGHALVLGTREWVDWRVRPGTGEMTHLAEEAYARGQVFVIAHPQSNGDPGCTGCAWRFGEMMPGNARLVEIWNGPWRGDSNNEPSLALWYDWLNQGWRLVATAGTDTHSPHDYAAGPGFNVVYSEEVSEAALLRALRAGHLYLSAGPQLDLQAVDERGGQWMVGDTVPCAATFRVAWGECPEGAQLRVIVNGRLMHQEPIGVQGEYAWSLAPEEADWVVVEIRGEDGGMLAISNPIYLLP